MTNEGCDKAENAVGEESTPAVAADAIENQTKGQNGLASIVCATEAAEPAMSSCDAKPSQVFVASPALPHGQGSAVNSPPNIGITNTPGTSSAVSCGQIGRPSSASPSFGQARNANCHFSLASGSQRQTVMRGMPSVTGSAQASQPSMGRLQGHAGGGGAMSQQTTVRMGQTYAATGMGHDQSSMRIEQLQKAMQGGMHGQVGPGRLLPGNSNGQGGMQHAFSTRMGVHGPQAGQQQPLVGVSRGSPMGPPKSGFQGASVSQLQGVPKQMLPNADFRPGAPRVMQQQPPPGRQPQQGDVNVMRSGRVVGMSGVGVRVSNGSAGMRSGPITDSFHMQWNQSGDMGQGAVLPNQQQQNMMAMQMQRQHRMQQQPQMQNQQRSDTMMFNSAGPSGMNGAGIAMLASSELEPIGCQSAGSSSIGEGPRISPRIQQGQQVQRPGQFDPPPVHMSSANTAAGRIFPCDSELFDSLGTTQQRIPLYQQQLQHDFGIGHQDLGSFANDSFLDDLPNIN